MLPNIPPLSLKTVLIHSACKFISVFMPFKYVTHLTKDLNNIVIVVSTFQVQVYNTINI